MENSSLETVEVAKFQAPTEHSERREGNCRKERVEIC